MSWFANRGQILQLIVAILALGVAVVGVTAALQATHIIELSDHLQTLLEHAIPIAVIAALIAAILWMPTFVSYLVLIVKLRKVFYREITLSVGDLWEQELAGTKYRLTIHSIQKGEKVSDPYLADVHVTDGGSLTGGSHTVKIGYNRFWVPVSSSSKSTDDGIYDLYITNSLVKILIIRIDHINVASGRVKFILSVVNWHLKSVI